MRHLLAHAQLVLLLALVAVGCGGDPDRPTADAGSTPGFIVTSTAFTGGGAIPVEHTCQGANTSPPLAWTGAPGGAESFALVLTDLSLDPPLVHTVMYDIAASTTELPAAVENTYAPGNVTGAHQTVSVHAPVVGYYGPCPPSAHTYEFAIHALDVAPLPGVTAQSTRTEARAQIVLHQSGVGKLVGTFTP